MDNSGMFWQKIGIYSSFLIGFCNGFGQSKKAGRISCWVLFTFGVGDMWRIVSFLWWHDSAQWQWASAYCRQIVVYLVGFNKAQRINHEYVQKIWRNRTRLRSEASANKSKGYVECPMLVGEQLGTSSFLKRFFFPPHLRVISKHWILFDILII